LFSIDSFGCQSHAQVTWPRTIYDRFHSRGHEPGDASPLTLMPSLRTSPWPIFASDGEQGSRMASWRGPGTAECEEAARAPPEGWLPDGREMNTQEMIHFSLADFLVAIARVLDGRMCMLPVAAYFLRPRPASLGSTSLVVHAENFVAPRSPDRLASAASSTPKETQWQKVLFPSPV
jgi:hypothetical protein